MADPDSTPPRPGPDEIVLSAPAAGELCSSLEHRRAGRPAQVVVTLGQTGTADRHREALWLGAWGHVLPDGGPCWQATRRVAQARRPQLVITGTARAPAGEPAPARPGGVPRRLWPRGARCPDQGCKARIKTSATRPAHACPMVLAAVPHAARTPAIPGEGR